MRLVLCMNDFVTTESRGLSEAFAADLAHKGTGSGVDWHMTSEIVMGVEDLPTLRTGKGLRFHSSASRRSRRGRSNRRNVSLRRVNVTIRRNQFLISGTLVHCFPDQLSAREMSRRRDFLVTARRAADTFNCLTLIVIRLNGEIGQLCVE